MKVCVCEGVHNTELLANVELYLHMHSQPKASYVVEEIRSCNEHSTTSNHKSVKTIVTGALPSLVPRPLTSYFFSTPPSNSWHSRLLAMDDICGTHRQVCVQIIADDGRRASARAVCFLRLVSMSISTADHTTEKLCILLPASIRPSCIAGMYLFQPSLVSVGFPCIHTFFEWI